MIQFGLRVVRGPNWNWGNQDGGDGHLGTILEIEPDNESVVIKWDTILEEPEDVQVGIDDDGDMAVAVKKKQYRYRAGKQYNAYDLRVFDNNSIGITHPGISCGGCNRESLSGTRWRCRQCGAFNLCTICYMSGQHSLKHSFIRFDTPDSIGVKLSPRCYSPQCEAYNLKDQDWDHGSREATGETTVKYYRDHLAPLGWNPTTDGWLKCPFLIGDRVAIQMDLQLFKALQFNHGGYLEEMKQCFDIVGTVAFIDNDGDVAIAYRNIEKTWTMNNATLRKIGPFGIGDYVVISEDLAEVIKYQQLHATWSDQMEQAVGQVGFVQSIYDTGNLILEIDGHHWEFSPMVCTVNVQADEEDGQHLNSSASDTSLTASVEQMNINELKSRMPTVDNIDQTDNVESNAVIIENPSMSDVASTNANALSTQRDNSPTQRAGDAAMRRLYPDTRQRRQSNRPVIPPKPINEGQENRRQNQSSTADNTDGPVTTVEYDTLNRHRQFTEGRQGDLQLRQNQTRQPIARNMYIPLSRNGEQNGYSDEESYMVESDLQSNDDYQDEVDRDVTVAATRTDATDTSLSSTEFDDSEFDAPQQYMYSAATRRQQSATPRMPSPREQHHQRVRSPLEQHHPQIRSPLEQHHPQMRSPLEQHHPQIRSPLEQHHHRVRSPVEQHQERARSPVEQQELRPHGITRFNDKVCNVCQLREEDGVLMCGHLYCSQCAMVMKFCCKCGKRGGVENFIKFKYD